MDIQAVALRLFVYSFRMILSRRRIFSIIRIQAIYASREVSGSIGSYPAGSTAGNLRRSIVR